MAHVFFFSYAHANLDNHLRDFFELLCEDVAPATKWPAQHPDISFRDGKNLALMDNWRPEILEALQTSAVFASVTSPAYFQSKFSGQEYRIFDQRRLQYAGNALPPEVVLPIIWHPIAQKLPFVHDIQLDVDGMSPLYLKKGLRWLKVFDRNAYERCVLLLAEAIQNAWKHYPPIPRLKNVPPFSQIPNAFASGQWEEAVDENGWIAGPSVANFVFAAAAEPELKLPAGRYGQCAAEWRPYLPPEPRTIADIARAAAKKHSLKYREIAVDEKLGSELHDTQERKNLTIVIADPQTLSVVAYEPISAFDTDTRVGTSLMILWDGIVGPWDTDHVQTTIKKLFRRKSQLTPPLFCAPIKTSEELDNLLDITLAQLLAAMTQNETKDKHKSDAPPAQITGVSGVPA